MKSVDIKLVTETEIDGETERNSYNYSGKYTFFNGKHCIYYSEQSPDGEINTVVKVTDTVLTIIRSGCTDSVLRIEKDKRYKTEYRTSVGVMDIFTTGISLHSRMETEQTVTAEYLLSCDSGDIGKNKIKIILKEV